MTRSLLLPVLLVAVPLTIGACGSSSSGSVPAFIANADTICKQANTALAPLGTKLTNAKSAVLARGILDTVSDQFKASIDQLAALTPPQSLAPAWHRYVNGVRQVQADLSGMARAVGSRDRAAFYRALGQADQAAAQARGALAGKGFKHCGQGH